MMNCIQCRRALDSTTSANGFRAGCEKCGIEMMSLGRLMKLSDSRVLTGIWDMIQSESLRPQWKKSSPCPSCTTLTMGVPFRHEGKEHALIACPKCYLVAMKTPTLKVFEDSNTQVAEKRIAAARAESHRNIQDGFQRDLDSARKIFEIGVKRADYLLNETPLREIRVTIGVAVAALLLSFGTMLLPYASLEVFGSAESSFLLSTFTHITFFHLAWNLLFFLPLSAAIEREMGGLRYALTYAVILSLSMAIGRYMSPFPTAPIVGLSPLISALIGRHLVLGSPMRIRLPGTGSPSFLFEPRSVAIVFAISELRTMIPSSGGMRWFTLGASIVAAGLSAALTEWGRRNVVEGNHSRKGKDVVLSQPSHLPVNVAASGASPIKSKVKQAA